uniref:Uncharacterized protein AlNc14C66G4688 n=1 Tax=Albugo laibachii Nc14 TaxID=890382 RepID=F0WDG8_9STRA|nr:hypothetical protein ALNC14_053830 [Albugo laibachii Nc14]|eukprot:CCA19240.1 hypothetical protein ALNC14_053830 [Albugo laibachii Nc14]
MARKQFVSFNKNAPNRTVSSKEAALHQRGQTDSTVLVENGVESAHSPLSSDTSDDSLMEDDSEIDVNAVAMEVLPSVGGRGKQLRFPVISKGKESRLIVPGNSDSESYASISSEGEDESIELESEVSVESEEDVSDVKDESKVVDVEKVQFASYPIKAHRVRKRHRPDTTYLKHMSTYIFDCLLGVRSENEMESLNSQRHEAFRKQLETGQVERVQWKPEENEKTNRKELKREKTGKEKKKKRAEKLQRGNELNGVEGKDEVRKAEKSRKRTRNTSTVLSNGVVKSDRKFDESQQPLEKRKNGLVSSGRAPGIEKKPVSESNSKSSVQTAEKDSKSGCARSKKESVSDTNIKSNRQSTENVATSGSARNKKEPVSDTNNTSSARSSEKDTKSAPTRTKKEPVSVTNSKSSARSAETDLKPTPARIKKEPVSDTKIKSNTQSAETDSKPTPTRANKEPVSDTTIKSNTNSAEKDPKAESSRTIKEPASHTNIKSNAPPAEKDPKPTSCNCKRKLEQVQEDSHTATKITRPVASFLIEFEPDPDVEKLRKEAAELNEQARKLKHEGNRQGGVNSDARRQVAQGVLYLRSSAKFFQHGLKLAQIKATFRAHNDLQHARTYGEYCITTLSQTCALIESTIRTFKSAGDVRMLAIGYKMAAIVHLTIYRLQHLKLFALYSDLFTPGRSPDSRQNGTTPPIVNITVGNQDNKEATVKKHLLKEMEHLLRGFDMWRRFETCNMNVLPLSTDPVTVNVREFVLELERELQNC